MSMNELKLSKREQMIYEAGVRAGAAQVWHQLGEMSQGQVAANNAQASQAIAAVAALPPEQQPSKGATLGARLGLKLRAFLDA